MHQIVGREASYTPSSSRLADARSAAQPSSPVNDPRIGPNQSICLSGRPAQRWKVTRAVTSCGATLDSGRRPLGNDVRSERASMTRRTTEGAAPLRGI